MIHPSHVVMRFIPFFLFGVVLLWGILLTPHIGVAWDEPDNIFAGGTYATFFTRDMNRSILETRDFTSSLFSGMIFTQEPAIARYPPFPNYLGTLLSLLHDNPTAPSVISAFHMATVIFFALLVTTVYSFGLLLGFSPFFSTLASIFTFLYPTLFGHGFSNLKDTAQVAMFTLTLYFLTRLTISKQKQNLMKAATLWGLALATKFNAIYVPIIWVLWDVTRNKIYDLRFKNLKSYLLYLKSYFLFLTVGIITTWIVWPYLWFDPLGHAREVITYFTTVGQGYNIFWDGSLYKVGVGKLLWWYPWMNLWLETPPPLLILWSVGVYAIVLEIKKKKSITIRSILLLWFTIPLLRAFLPMAAFYDGMRHFMEVLPAGILISVIGSEKILEFVTKRYRTGRLLCHFVVLLLCFYLISINLTLFPYSSGYFNSFAHNTNQQFDRDIEALSVREAVEYLHKQYGPLKLWSPIGGHLSWYYLNPYDTYVYSKEEADSIILVNKSSHIRQEEFEKIISPSYSLDHTITRGDAIFAWIYRKTDIQ
jgi:hypothetical protein